MNTFPGYGEALFSYSLTAKPTPESVASTHIHHSYELLFFYGGDADYSIAGSIYHLKKNDLLLIRPSTYHNIILHSEHPYERIVCHFREYFLTPEIQEELRSLGAFFHVEQGSPLDNLFTCLKNAQPLLGKKDFEQFFLLALPLIILQLKHINNVVVKEKLPFRSTLDKILAYIDENPTQPLSLAQLSSTFYLSESHIAHLFKKHLNVSATQYIHRKKITYAQSLIASGMMPAQVAEKCSYDSYATFYRHYKKYLGVPPMQHYTK